MNSPFTSKFVQLLKTFDENDLKSFDQWLRSPWCTSNKNLIKLFQAIKKYHPHYHSTRMTKEKLFYKILPEGKYSNRRLNNLTSEAFLAARKFLIFNSLTKQETTQNHLWSDNLQKRYLDEWFFRDTQQAIEAVESIQNKEWEDHLSLYQLNRQVYQHPNAMHRIRSGKLNLIEMDRQLDLIYLLEKGSILVEKQSRSKIIHNEKYEIEEDIKRWQEATQSIDHPAIRMYKLRLTYTPETFQQKYRIVRNLFLSEVEVINQREQKMQLFLLLNDTIRLIKTGTIDITEALPLYKLGMQKGILLTQGKLSQNTFCTILSASNTKGDFTYSKHFVSNYAATLDQKLQKDAICWAKAHTAYWKKNLKRSIQLLTNHEFENYYFQLIGRLLTIQVYFELYLQDNSYHEYLLSYLNAYEKWLQRDKTFAKSSHQSFIRFTQLCRILTHSYSALEFDSIKVENLLTNEKNVQSLNWLKKQQKKILALKAESADY